MEYIIVIMVLLAVIIISNIINRILPQMPTTLVLIALGIGLAISPLGIRVDLPQETFMLLFIAPLLFNDGIRISNRELWHQKWKILMMALGLVFVTVGILGVLIHLLIPSMPLAASFALAAILSPTDAVAVVSLSKKINLPPKIITLLEGEALINDASGLIALKYAVAAVVSGVFSFQDASVNFLIVSVGGTLVGVILALLIAQFQNIISRFGMEDTNVHMLIKVMTPFIIYIAAEEFHFSGVLAVVAAGICLSFRPPRINMSVYGLKTVSENTWSVILYVLNGLVFVILGLQLPDALHSVLSDTTHNNSIVIMYILVIALTLMLLRFLWVLLIVRREKKRALNSFLTSLSGVKGAVTLAAALSLPLTAFGGEPFPERSLIIFIAAGVILFSLLMANITLPLLCKKKDTSSAAAEQKALRLVVAKTIAAIKQEANEDNKVAVFSVEDMFEEFLGKRNGAAPDSKRRERKMSRDILLTGLRAEIEKAARMLTKQEADKEALYRIIKDLSTREFSLSHNFRHVASKPIFFMRLLFTSKKHKNNPDMIDAFKRIKVQTCEAAIAAIESSINEENRAASLAVIRRYMMIAETLKRENKREHMELYRSQKIDIEIKALQTFRDEIQTLFETGGINREIAHKLRGYANYLETMLAEDESHIIPGAE